MGESYHWFTMLGFDANQKCHPPVESTSSLFYTIQCTGFVIAPFSKGDCLGKSKITRNLSEK